MFTVGMSHEIVWQKHDQQWWWTMSSVEEQLIKGLFEMMLQFKLYMRGYGHFMIMEEV